MSLSRGNFALPLLLVCGACSFRSLDYLDTAQDSLSTPGGNPVDAGGRDASGSGSPGASGSVAIGGSVTAFGGTAGVGGNLASGGVPEPQGGTPALGGGAPATGGSGGTAASGMGGMGGMSGMSSTGGLGGAGTCTGVTCQPPTCEEGVFQDGCPLLLDDTPYQFSPAHALSSCLDDTAYSVAEGGAQVLWGCKNELQQTFWAVARTDGYFALRSALSGKCLQVRGASSGEGAVVEQSACDDAAEQWWKPTRVDASLLQLTNKVSGLALSVAGDNVGTNGQPIVQSKADGSPDTHWHPQRRLAATHLILSPYGDRSLRLRHAGALVTITTDASAAAHWRVMPGLADPRQVSFQSRDEPGRYLRHADFRLWADTSDGSDQFLKDATFQFAAPLIGADPLSKSLQPINYASRRAQKSDDTVLFPNPNDLDAKSATWWLRPN